MHDIDRIILGDNQFFGVNHMSEDRGRETYEQFKDMKEIERIMLYALDKGVTGVSFSTHPSIGKVCDMIRANPRLRDNFNIYVNVPYIVKYISMVTQMGMYNAMKSVILSYPKEGRSKFLAKAAGNALTLDHIGVLERLIDMEVSPFRGLNVKAIFLHSALCDIALGYQLKEILLAFDSYIRKAYGAIPGYGTLNFAPFAQYMDEIGLGESLIMTSCNKLGFQMNPSRAACEEEIAATKHTVIGMVTLASGCLKPEEAYEYLAGIGVKNVIVGLSSPKHADETFGCIERHILGKK